MLDPIHVARIRKGIERQFLSATSAKISSPLESAKELKDFVPNTVAEVQRYYLESAKELKEVVIENGEYDVTAHLESAKELKVRLELGREDKV